jgi:methyl-accepting chemotaxis protein
MFLSTLERLSLRHRFSLLGLVVALLVGPPCAGWMSRQLEERAVLERERAGLAPALALLKAHEAIALHRHLSLRQLSGDRDAAAERHAVQQTVERVVTEARAALRHQSAATRHPFEAATQGFATLAQGIAKDDLQARAAFDQHEPLLEGLAAAMARTLAESGLLFDRAPRTHFHIVAGLQEGPAIVSLLGQLRSLGASALANKGATQLDLNQIAALHAQIGNRQRFFEHNLRAAAEHDADVGERESITAAMTQALTLTEKNFLGIEADWSAPKDDYYRVMGAAIEHQVRLTNEIARSIEATLSATENGIDRRIVAVGIGLALLLACGGTLLVSSVRRISIDADRALAVTQSLAAGRLDITSDVQARADSRNELDRLMLSLDSLRLQWAASIREVRQAVSQTSHAAAGIAHGNQDLSVRTEEASANLQQSASALQAVTQALCETAASAQAANALASSAEASAARGGGVVADVVATMDEIVASARRIADISGVIDAIAFQTNILALNAAVEAARAGEEGRGFAVVAGEVRTLAQRSAHAAQEIKSLVGSSTERAEAGARRAADAGRAMIDISGEVQRVSEIIRTISVATASQSDQLGRVNDAVDQLESMTQQNAALVEQSAAAAQSLDAQAQQLAHAVAVFTVHE